MQLKACYAHILRIALVVLLRGILVLVIDWCLWQLQQPIGSSKCTWSALNPEWSILRAMRMWAVSAIRLKFIVLFLIFNSYGERISLIGSCCLSHKRLAFSEYRLGTFMIALFMT